MTVDSGASFRPLRADAVRNREKILAAAAGVFADRGLDVTFDDIAAAANVGVATVYRRFPDKDALIVALFEHGVEEIATLAENALDAADSWDGFVWFLEEVLERLCGNTGLRDVILGASYAEERIASAKLQIIPAMMALIERAQRDGYLRNDLVEVDMSVLEMMITTLGGDANRRAPDLWRRYLRIILDGLVVTRSQPSELPPCPPLAEVLAAIQGSRGSRGDGAGLPRRG